MAPRSAVRAVRELSLERALKPVRGILLAAAHARAKAHELIVPRAKPEEARIVSTAHLASDPDAREAITVSHGPGPDYLGLPLTRAGSTRDTM